MAKTADLSRSLALAPSLSLSLPLFLALCLACSLTLSLSLSLWPVRTTAGPGVFFHIWILIFTFECLFLKTIQIYIQILNIR